jgi:quinol monooxygenase YgiN
MATIIMQHSVKDFAAWKMIFDSAAAMRKAGGELSAHVYRDVSDPNRVTVVNQWNSMENAQKFVQSPDLKAAMEKAGVVGPPSISFLSEA